MARSGRIRAGETRMNGEFLIILGRISPAGVVLHGAGVDVVYSQLCFRLSRRTNGLPRKSLIATIPVLPEYTSVTHAEAEMVLD